MTVRRFAPYVLVFGVLFARPAMSADLTTEVAQFWERFKTICYLAITAPDDYIASLEIPGPGAGEPVLETSPDGRFRLVHTAQEIDVSEFVEFARFQDREHRGCEMDKILSGAPEVDAVVEALRAAVEPDVKELVGGRILVTVPIWSSTYGASAAPLGDWYMFQFFGVWDDLDLIASARIDDGSLSFFVAQDVPAKRLD